MVILFLICLIGVFSLFRICKQSWSIWHNLTHLDEYYARLKYNKDYQQLKKQAIVQYNHETMERFKNTGIML